MLFPMALNGPRIFRGFHTSFSLPSRRNIANNVGIRFSMKDPLANGEQLVKGQCKRMAKGNSLFPILFLRPRERTSLPDSPLNKT